MKIKEFLTDGMGWLIGLAFWSTIAFIWGCNKGEGNERARVNEIRQNYKLKCDSLENELDSVKKSSKGSVSLSKYLYIDSCGITHVDKRCLYMKLYFDHPSAIRVPLSEATMKTINRCCLGCVPDEVYDSLKTYITGEKSDISKKMPHLTALLKKWKEEVKAKKQVNSNLHWGKK